MSIRQALTVCSTWLTRSHASALDAGWVTSSSHDLRSGASAQVAVRLDGPADVLFDILRRSPPVVWRDPDRRRLWCSYLATQIVEQLVAFPPGALRQRAEAEEVIAGELFLGPAPEMDAFARGAWAQSATQQILACLHPLLERTEHAP
jgi:hypothetical protein